MAEVIRTGLVMVGTPVGKTNGICAELTSRGFGVDGRETGQLVTRPANADTFIHRLPHGCRTMLAETTSRACRRSAASTTGCTGAGSGATRGGTPGSRSICRSGASRPRSALFSGR
jgi:hypothetical protein